MLKLVVIKKFHYPSGSHGRDYQIGEELVAHTERDAKALRLLRFVKDAPQEEQEVKQSPQVKQLEVKQVPPPDPSPEPAPVAKPSSVAEEYPVDEEDTSRRRRRGYTRRDMKPEDAGGDEQA